MSGASPRDRLPRAGSAPRKTRVIRLLYPLTLVVAFLALVAPATAASPDAVIRDCVDDKLDGTYSTGDLRWARDHLPTDIDEYSNCRELIAAALGSSSGKGNQGRKGVASTAPPDAKELAARAGDQKELDRLAADRETPRGLEVGGQSVQPGSNGLFDVASASNGLPFPLLLALIGLGLLTLAGGFLALRSRVPLLARIPLPSRGRRPRPHR
jgi:hypothetical protein